MPRLPLAHMRFVTDLIFRIYRKRRFMGFRLLRLTTIGARTGRERRTVLGYFDDPANPEARIIVASAAGSARHPAWYFNLAKHPDKVWIEVGDEKLQVQAELLSDGERMAAWQRVVAEAPSYAAYPTKTDRQIPLVRLTPVSSPR
jgi:deazaflavin-dependent oxidoreductase (nitroreductase family)